MAVEVAANIRKGNIIEHTDGHLYVVLKAESFRPGKGTPTTTIEMRRISDGVKTVITTKTQEKLEKAFVEEVDFTYLYQDGENYVFMHPETFEQLYVSASMVGDGAPFLQENMVCILQIFNGDPVSVTLPPRVTVEVVETEPVVKGQTASSSYKPAMTDVGVRVMVPPHIDAGTRIVVNTEDNSYLERSKD
ncbi:elongation factor P [Ponticaulis sp.]|uniref:elongation factor P n=1 Tax=Ponticaulis sp. TaxID=2020902 RepID=UPI000B715A1E|nr:elongation factor P [Ponticaulis sp.]MAI89158.1 elongation factor P [Ponticaulis sp.]OUY01155.1 MAG: elongation factor P [Hyphomonadaceae bacterium TMED5]|tara:strand:+ start:110286 stop:110858 length:573 start_codon:yes stop_codon:yes gene_type:complete